MKSWRPGQDCPRYAVRAPARSHPAGEGFRFEALRVGNWNGRPLHCWKGCWLQCDRFFGYFVKRDKSVISRGARAMEYVRTREKWTECFDVVHGNSARDGSSERRTSEWASTARTFVLRENSGTARNHRRGTTSVLNGRSDFWPGIFHRFLSFIENVPVLMQRERSAIFQPH